MNKIFSASLSLLAVASCLTGCKNEEDDIFEGSAAQRLTQIAATYTERLAQPANGWIMQLYPQNSDVAYQGSGYLVGLKFNADQSVTVGMDNFLSDNKYAEDTSLWEVISDNGPVLTFNSYNKCLHAFSDPEAIAFPDGNADDSGQGTGVGGDYEFVVVDAPEDLSYMMLKGKKRATYNIMRPLEDGYTFESYMNEVNAMKNRYFASASPVEPLLQMGDSAFSMVDASDVMPGFYPYGGDAITQTVSDPFIVTKRGGTYYLRFRDAFEANGYSVQEFRLDEAADQFVSTDNESLTITGGYAPDCFNKAIFTDGKRWELTSTSSMADEVKTLYANVAAGFKKVSYTLNRINLTSGEDGTLAVSLQCTYRKTTPAVTYNYSFTLDGDKATFGYFGGNEDLLDRVGGLREFVNFMSQQFTITKNITNFNLSTVKLTSVGDPNLWFVVTLK